MHNTRLPQIIYLPSSGGHTGSRITPELITRRRFPFRRYSIQEDGSLVARVKHLDRVARPHPYAKPAVRSNTPPLCRGSISLDPESPSTRPTSTSTSDPNLNMELLKNLVPALIEDPTSFEELISSICAAHGIDESVISAVTQATKRSMSLGRPLESARTLDQSTPSVVIPSLSTTGSISPIKQERPFPSGSLGVTTWYSSHSLSALHGPAPNLDSNVGDLYVHNNRAEASHQVWLFGLDRSWMHVDVAGKVYHPTIADRVLSMRANGTPSWITAASYTTIKLRKEKAKAIG
ncbi:hypothetical protein BDM02DRAFT_3188596 [Thelephora ganbajun]|uniref:Uncharacterized protein n=1 Tax=Thelephora ganbajun TaxID=370292 RepID=A0ACB6ZBD3_THEGA|nr:hypothetical protein BDM02DRAFT_3188596 [Thelephora ganbajun]